MEVIRIKEILAQNWSIGICLHCVRTLLWFVPTMSTLTLSVAIELRHLFVPPRSSRQLCVSLTEQCGLAKLVYHTVRISKNILLYSLYWAQNPLLGSKPFTVCKHQSYTSQVLPLLLFWSGWFLFLGPVADSGIQLPNPLIFNIHIYSEMADSPKIWPILQNQQEELATSKSPLLAV